MKKFAWIISGFIIGAGMNSAFAADCNIFCDNQLRTVNFTLNEYSGNEVVVYVQDSDQNIIAIGETKEKDGIKSAVLPIPGNTEEGYYTAVMGDWDAKNDIEAVPYAQRSKKIYISAPGNESEILSAFNGASEITADGVLKKYSKELDLSIDDDYKPSCGTAFVAVRGQKVYTAYSDIIKDFNTAKAAGFFADASEDELKSGEGKYIKYAGIIHGDDYEEYKEDIWRVFTNVRGKITSKSDVTKTIAEWYSESAAVAAVNSASRTSAEGVLKKYSVKIGIDYTKYSNLSDETKKMNVLKAVTGKKFNSANDVKTAYDNAVAEQMRSNSSNTNGGWGSGGNTASGGGGGSSVPSSQTLPYSNTALPTASPGATPTQAPLTEGFSDMPNSHWAYKAVSSLHKDKIMTGYDDGTIKPDKMVTRAEFIKLLTSALGIYDQSSKCKFADVEDDAWYMGYVASAVNNGITTGYPDNTFCPNAPLTREDAALMIYRAAGFTQEAQKVDFTDKDLISDYAYNAVGVLSEKGILNGFENGEFMPAQTITRAQTAQIIYNLREEAKR